MNPIHIFVFNKFKGRERWVSELRVFEESLILCPEHSYMKACLRHVTALKARAQKKEFHWFRPRKIGMKAR
jgi:hypothetical protein